MIRSITIVLIFGSLAVLAGCGDDSTTKTVTQTAPATAANPAVLQLQLGMTSLGYYEGPIDGVYGEETTAAVKELQTDLGVTADGRVGTETVTAFNEAVESGKIEPASQGS